MIGVKIKIDGSIDRKVIFVILWSAAVCPCSKRLSCPTASLLIRDLKTNIGRRQSYVLYLRTISKNPMLNVLDGPRGSCPRALL